MKNSVGDAIVVSTGRVIDVKKEEELNCDSFSVTVSDVADYKVSLRSVMMVAISLSKSLARLLVTSLTFITVNTFKSSLTTLSFNLVNI